MYCLPTSLQLHRLTYWTRHSKEERVDIDQDSVLEAEGVTTETDDNDVTPLPADAPIPKKLANGEADHIITAMEGSDKKTASYETAVDEKAPLEDREESEGKKGEEGIYIIFYGWS